MIITLHKLLQKARQVTDPRDAHALALDLVESMLRHYAVVAIAAYRHAGARDPKVNRILTEQLPRPSMGSWKNFLQVLAASDRELFPEQFREKFLAPLTRKVSHPDISPAYAGLRKLADQDVFAPPESPVPPEATPCTPLEFFDAAVAYRNRFAGHGTHELPDAALRFAPTFLKGAAALCAHLHTLWLACPVYVAKQAKLYGRTFFRLTPLVEAEGISELQAAAPGMEEDRLYICFGDRKHPEVESLYPAALWEEDDILFANGTKGLIDIHYIGYASQRSFETSIYEEDFRAFLGPFAPPRTPDEVKPATTPAPVSPAPAPSPHVKGKQKLVLASLGLVLLLIAAIAGYWQFGHKKGPVSQVSEEQEIKSIAVLPFRDMSPGKDQDYLCEGIAETIINTLVQFEQLRIISRNSSFVFKGEHRNIKAIGDSLKVNTVLEGSIQKAGNRLRITAQLINVADESHIFSKQFDHREIEDIFSIQDTISMEIVKELKGQLLTAEEKMIKKRYTVNPDAYVYYLRGNDYEDKKNIKNAIIMFQKAIELDPTFAQAYARLSYIYMEMYWFYNDKTQECLAKAKEAVDKALQLNPKLPDAYRSLGYYYYWGYLDYDRALEQFSTGLKYQPNDSGLLAGIGYVQRRQGKFEQALANIKKSSLLDPLNTTRAIETGTTYLILRNYSEAERYYNKVIEMAPDLPDTYDDKVWLYLTWEGSTNKAWKVMEKAFQNIKSAENPLFLDLVTINICDGNYQEALNQLNLHLINSDKSVTILDNEGIYYNMPYALIYAQLYRYMNKKDLAHGYYESARNILETKIKEMPDNSLFYSFLGIAYAGLNQRKEAIRYGKLAVEMLPIRKEAMSGQRRLEDLARIYVMIGEYSKAIDILELLLSNPGWLSKNLLQVHPDWDPLHDQPRFRMLVN